MERWGQGQARRRFEIFVDQQTDGLVRTGYLMTGDLPETEDLVQETFLRVARRWDRVRRMEYPAAYARKILVSLVLDGAKKRSRRRAELLAGGDGEPNAELADAAAADPFRRVESMASIRAALADLPRQQRAVLVLRYVEDLPEDAVAEMLGCSVGTVKKTTWRAVQRLRDTLGQTPARIGAAAADERNHP